MVGDFDGDGKPDLAFASQSSNVVTILFGNGDGTFRGHIEYSVPSVSNNVNFMVAADFNGDGALDIALADFGNGGTGEVSVFVNQPVAAFSPRVLKFANQGIGTTSSAQSVTLTNGGAAPLAITSIVASGDFAETNDCGSSLSIEKACNVNVAFTPSDDGVRTGMLSFIDNGSVVPQVLAISGTGTGPGFVIGVAPGSSASQTVAAGQAASYSLVFTPVSGFNGTITLACSGAPTGATCTTPHIPPADRYVRSDGDDQYNYDIHPFRGRCLRINSHAAYLSPIPLLGLGWSTPGYSFYVYPACDCRRSCQATEMATPHHSNDASLPMGRLWWRRWKREHGAPSAGAVSDDLGEQPHLQLRKSGHTQPGAERDADQLR